MQQVQAQEMGWAKRCNVYLWSDVSGIMMGVGAGLTVGYYTGTWPCASKRDFGQCSTSVCCALEFTRKWPIKSSF